MGRAYLRICKESSWGSLPGAPSWVYLALKDDAFNMRLAKPTLKPVVNVGYVGRKWQVPNKHLGEGRLATFLQPANVEFLLQSFYTRTSNELNSYSIEYEGTQRAIRALGVRVASATLTADPEDFLNLELELVAKEIVTSGVSSFATSAKAGISGVAPFKLQDCGFTLDAGTPTSITTLTSFNLAWNNNLSRGPHLGSTMQVAWLEAGNRDVSFDSTWKLAGTTWLTAKDASTNVKASFIGEHPAQGTDARFTIHFADGVFETAETPDNVNEPTMATFHHESEMDASNNDVVIVVENVT